MHTELGLSRAASISAGPFTAGQDQSGQGWAWLDTEADHVVGSDDLLLPRLGVYQHVANPGICLRSVLPLLSDTIHSV